MSDLGRARGRRNGGGIRSGYNSWRSVSVNETLNKRLSDCSLHTHDGCTNVDTLLNYVGLIPFDEDQSPRLETDLLTTECHPAINTRRYFLENPDTDEQENLSMSESSGSRKSYSLPAWIDDTSITSSVGAAPSDEDSIGRTSRQHKRRCLAEALFPMTM
jgi:hypothetical protein